MWVIYVKWGREREGFPGRISSRMESDAVSLSSFAIQEGLGRSRTERLPLARKAKSIRPFRFIVFLYRKEFQEISIEIKTGFIWRY